MAPSGKARHRSHRHRRDAEEEVEEEQEEEEDDSLGTVARRKSSSSKHRDSGEKEKERDDAKRGHKRKHSSDAASSRSTKKTRSGETEGAVVSGVEEVPASSEKKGRKSDHGRSSDSGSRHKKSKDKKHSETDKDGDRTFTDVECDRYRYNAEDDYSRDRRDDRDGDRERYKSDGDDRKDRDRDAKHHREHKDERSKRSHSDLKHTDPDRSKGTRKKFRDHEDQHHETRTSKEEDGHHKESKHRSRNDFQERRSKASDKERNDDKDEIKSSKEERSHRAHEEERRVNGGERHEEKHDKEKVQSRSDGERERKDKDDRTQSDSRSGKERTRVSSREESRTKDSERRSPGDGYSSRKDKLKHESDYRGRSRSRDRSNEDDYRRRQRYYKDERDERSHHYRGSKDYRDEEYKRSSDDRYRRGPSSSRSSARPDDYSRRGGSYRRSDGAEELWSWKNGFFPPFAPHYGVGGFLEHFPASIYGPRGSIYPHPRFMRAPSSFVGEDEFSNPWYSAAAMEHFREPKDRAPPDEQAPLGSPKNSCEEPTGGKRFSLKDARFTEDMRQLMTRLSVSKELAGPEAYEEYMEFMENEKIEAPELEAGEPAVASDLDDDLVLEADPEGEDLLREVDGDGLSDISEPPLLLSRFEDALKLYRKPEEENRLRKSLVGSFLLPLECVSLLQSQEEEEARPSRDFSETASGVECSTGADPSVTDGRHTRGETTASQEAGEAVKVVTDNNGGGDFSWEKMTRDVAVGLEVVDDDKKNVTNGEGSRRDNPGSDDRHLDYNDISISDRDGDKIGFQDNESPTPLEDTENAFEAHENENLGKEQEAKGVVEELGKANDDWTGKEEAEGLTSLKPVEQLECRVTACQLGVLESLEQVEEKEVIARIKLEARDEALEPGKDLDKVEDEESAAKLHGNRIKVEARAEQSRVTEVTVESHEDRNEVKARGPEIAEEENGDEDISRNNPEAREASPHPGDGKKSTSLRESLETPKGMSSFPQDERKHLAD